MTELFFYRNMFIVTINSPDLHLQYPWGKRVGKWKGNIHDT